MRHNRVRDLEASLMREVCHNVQVEPELLPIESDALRRGNIAEKARLDVAGVGVWGAYGKNIFRHPDHAPQCPHLCEKTDRTSLRIA